MENPEVLNTEVMSTRRKMKSNKNAETVGLSTRAAYSR